ncbi:hypothetical protein A1O1_08698 [Capronia coronata CBS 617.96]|uniref:Zn(2)-C6 fungal-type domain-containing protein n=1 Tax=Capronia coronata CBS 617.96 TaxID=1182541 RepID=W9XJ56_9EURO|nr:uncharacterized protein A1O1_08698 [Capronia coronata CBS 617.96]EXJ80552.1 hypothetical protein A1O1_08698 [Capronia coronata CBS 617.96]
MLQLPPATRPAIHPTACRNCRRRGRRCDKTLPTCLSCKNRLVACEGYVTRWTGVAARGKLAGKSKPVLDDEEEGRTSPEQPRCSRATTSTTSVSPRQRQRHQKQLAASQRLGSLKTIGQPDSLRADGLDVFIDYFVHELSYIPYLGSNPGEGPYLRYVRPLTNTVLPLRYVVAASASLHLASRLCDEPLRNRSRELQLKASVLLRQRLTSKTFSMDHGTVLTMLMMAQLDMCTGDLAEFDIHVPAAKAFVRAYGTVMPDRSYCEQRLAWWDIMRATTSTRLLTFTSTDLKKTISRYQSPHGGREWGCDAFACPVDLAEYIADVTMLYKLQPADRPFAADVMQRAALLASSVRAWTPTQSYSEPMSHVVGAWHASILLYIIRLFRLHEHENEHDEAHMFDDTAALRDSVFVHARSVPTPSAWSIAIHWPLLQAGLWLEQPDVDAEQRDWLRTHFTRMMRHVGCRQFTTVTQLLESVWASNEYHNSITAASLAGPLVIA